MKPADASFEEASAGFLSHSQRQKLETWLDSKFRVPGTSFRVGLDGILGLVPGLGDLSTTALSTLFIADAWKVGARKRVIAKMVGNLAIDATIGALPLIGDLFDFFFKSNTKNLRLLMEEIEYLHGKSSAQKQLSA